MNSIQDIQRFVIENLGLIMALTVFFTIVWFLRGALARLILWGLRRRLDESNHFIITVIENSIYEFIERALLTLIIYSFTIALGRNPEIAAIVNNIVLTILLITVIRLILELVKAVTASSYRLNKITRLKVDRTLMPLIRLLARGVVYMIGLFAIAQTWSLNLSTVVAGLGIGGLAVSFAAQDSIKNLIGFVIIVTDKPFVLDEYIATPTAEGTIEEIGLRSVRIRALNQSLIIVPNDTIVNQSVTNWSRLEKRWFNFIVGLPFTTTVEQIETFTREVREMLQLREHVEPETVLTLFVEYDSSALNVLIRFYVMLPNWADAHAERNLINLEINRIISHHNLTLALPGRYLTFEQVEQLSAPDQRMSDRVAPDEPPSQSGQTSRTTWENGDDLDID